MEFCASAASNGSHVALSQHLLSLSLRHDVCYCVAVNVVRFPDYDWQHCVDVPSDLSLLEITIEL